MALGETATVSYGLSGTATSGDDYDSPSGSVSFGAGDSSATISISVTDDALYDGGDETLIVSLTGATGSVLGSSASATESRTVQIEDDESSPAASFVAGTSSSVSESVGASLSVALSPASDESVDVIWTVSGTGSPTLDASSRTLTYAAESSSATISLATNDDLFNGVNRVWTFGIASVGGSSPSSSVEHALTLTDDESAATVSFAATSVEINESESGSLSVRLSRALKVGEPSASVEFGVVASETDAESGDYTVSTSSPLSFPSDGSTRERMISISTLEDTSVEGDEDVVISLLSATGGAVLSGSDVKATATILDDDDDAVRISFASPSATLQVVESGDSGTLSSRFDLEISGAPSERVTVSVSAESSSPVSATITSGASRSFPTSSTSATTRRVDVDLTGVNDSVRNSSRSFDLILSTSSGSDVVTFAERTTVTIVDDEPVLYVAVGDSSSIGGDVSVSESVADGLTGLRAFFVDAAGSSRVTDTTNYG